MRAGIFAHSDVGKRIQSRRIIHGIHRDVKAAGHGIVQCLAIIDRNSNRSAPETIRHRREAEAPGRVGTGIGHSRIGNKTRIARSCCYCKRLRLVRGARSYPGEVDRLRAGIFIHSDIGNGIQRGRIIHGIHRDGKTSDDCIILRLAVIDRDRNRRVPESIRHRRKAEATCRVGTGIADCWVGDKARIAGAGSNRKCLRFIAATGANTSKRYGLRTRIFVDG